MPILLSHAGLYLSNSVAGYLAKSRGDDFTFYVLAGVAVVGFVVFLLFMPETRDRAVAAG